MTPQELSKVFWEGLEQADTAKMRSVCDPEVWFVHIGMSCGLDHEMEAFDRGIFKPTEIVLHDQLVKDFGDVQIVLSDVDYGLLLGGQPTTHHFMTTEVFQKQADGWKMIQFTFTALVH